MRRIVKILASLILLLLIAIVAAPFLIPAETLKNQAIIKIEELTGRKVSMGNVKLSLFPNIALNADDVTIGNPSWVKDAGNMAEVKNLRIGVELMPLLQKDIHVTDLSLESPTIHLIKKGAQANWQFATNAPPQTEKAAEREAKAETKRIAAPFRLDTLSISNGTLLFEDSATGTKQSFSKVNAKLNSKDLPKSVTLKGDALYKNTKADINLALGSPLDLPIGGASEVDLSATYGPNAVVWKGTVTLKAGVPSITGTVAIPEINTVSTAAGNGEAAAKPAPAYAERWSSAPISMEALSAANADVNVTIDKLVLSQMTLSNVKAHAKLQNGNLQLGVDELPMFSGSTKLDLTANHSGAVSIKAGLKNIQTEELLTTMAKSKVLTGVLNGNVNLSARGNSQRAMVGSLEGSGSIVMIDGVFRGGNLLNMTKNIATSFQAGQSKGETTDFSKLGGTFTAKNGVIFNNDLMMEGPLMHLTGKGQIDLPEWQVHYLLTPQLITNRGSDTQAASGIAVPVQVSGSLDSPSYHPDLRGVLEEGLKDPEKLKQNLKDIRTNIKEKGINKDMLKGLLGR